jgi:aspartate/methionine/tyrosine aminotransferase
MIVIHSPHNSAGAVLSVQDIIELRQVKEFGAPAIPTPTFYADGTDKNVLRFCFAKRQNTLEEAAARLRGFAK